MVDKIVMHSYSYLMNSTYERIKEGKCFDSNFRTYEKDFVEKIIFYFEEIEEYEKCKILLDFSKERFDHEKNYAMA
jgi:hypothetical protein